MNFKTKIINAKIMSSASYWRRSETLEVAQRLFVDLKREVYVFQQGKLLAALHLAQRANAWLFQLMLVATLSNEDESLESGF